MKAFISYSSNQIKIAKQIKDFLGNLNIDSFIANDDLRVSSDWKKDILSEFKNCELFIAVLSQEFKKSDWCSQEMAIGYIKKKHIIPISIDGTKPYGFISHIQSRPISEMGLELIISEGLMEKNPSIGASGFIELIQTSETFRFSEKIYKTMEPYFKNIEKSDLNKIIECSIKNSQVWDAAKCAMDYIPKLLQERKRDIEPKKYNELKKKIKNRMQ